MSDRPASSIKPIATIRQVLGQRCLTHPRDARRGHEQRSVTGHPRTWPSSRTSAAKARTTRPSRRRLPRRGHLHRDRRCVQAGRCRHGDLEAIRPRVRPAVICDSTPAEHRPHSSRSRLTSVEPGALDSAAGTVAEPMEAGRCVELPHDVVVECWTGWGGVEVVLFEPAEKVLDSHWRRAGRWVAGRERSAGVRKADRLTCVCG